MASAPMRVLFLVQGEGRGHLTQAIALRELLAERGHEVCGVFVGSPELELPEFFAERIGHEPGRYFSPRTVLGPDRRRISATRTLAYTAFRSPAYVRAIVRIRRAIRELVPDLVVNFYDSVAGMAVAGPGGPRVPMVSVGHHYLLNHPTAPQPPGSPLDVAPLRVLTPLTAPGRTTRLALSLQPFPDGPTATTHVVPPLLRRAVLDTHPTEGRHLLVYLLHDGFARELVAWHLRRPDLLLHAFLRREGAPEEEVVRSNLVFHRLSETRFLELMRSARGVVGTAGFESVAEAMWFGKPVMVVPTGGHVEQGWNARKAVAAGAGIAAQRFDLDPFLEYLPKHRPTTGYREWVLQGRERLGTLVEEAVHVTWTTTWARKHGGGQSGPFG